MSIIKIQKSKKYPPRSLKSDEAKNEFGFEHKIFALNREGISERIFKMNDIDKAMTNLIVSYFTPSASLAPYGNEWKVFNGYELDETMPFLEDDFRRAVEYNINSLKFNNSFFKLKTDKTLSNLYSQHIDFVSKYGSFFKPNRNKEELTILKELNVLKHDDSVKHVCNIPYIDFRDIAFHSVSISTLFDIANGENPFNFEQYQFDHLSFEDLNENATVNLHMRSKNTKKERSFYMIFNNGCYEFYTKQSKDEVFFESKDGANEFLEEIKDKISKNEILFNF